MTHTTDIEKLNCGLIELFDQFGAWEASIIQEAGLSLSEAHAIEVLGTTGAINMKELAEKLGVTTATTTVTVDRLEKGKYARRMRAENDRRSYMINLTSKGKRVFEEHHNHHLELTKKIASKLTEDEIDSFLNILEKINTCLTCR